MQLTAPSDVLASFLKECRGMLPPELNVKLSGNVLQCVFLDL
jgi:hypothetical protein